MVNQGQSPIVEEHVGELISAMVAAGRLRATTDVGEAVAATDLSLVCVGTPSGEGGALDARYVCRVAEQIGAALRSKSGYHVVTVRSTVLPGTMQEVVRPALEAHSGKKAGVDFGLCFHPEFLREGSSVRDFREPPKIVIGVDNDERTVETLLDLYQGFTAPVIKTSIPVAEMVKYTDNCFHALKVVFGNEIGTLCKALGVDSHEVMQIFCQDRKLNISPAYFMPGLAYGGSCLPKDLRALNYLARTRNIHLPVMNSIQASNDLHLGRILDAIVFLGKRNVGLLGLSFKRGTDDLRESPLVELVERLMGKGFRIRIYDENVVMAKLRGGNKAYISQRLPHISELLTDDMKQVVEGAEVVVVGAANPQFVHLIEAHCLNKVVVDLVRLFKTRPEGLAGYHGVCW
jgi:GDP-mannose 6-dehydrogenase